MSDLSRGRDRCPKTRSLRNNSFKSFKKRPQPLDGTAAGLQTFQPRLDSVVRHQFDATVLGPSLGRVVRGDEVGLAVAMRNQLARRDSVFHQVVHDGVSPTI